MFQSLFCDFYESLGHTMLDLIFTLGSGSTAETQSLIDYEASSEESKEEIRNSSSKQQN